MVLLGAQFALNLINVFHPHREMVRNIKVNPPQERTIFFTAKLPVMCVQGRQNEFVAGQPSRK